MPRKRSMISSPQGFLVKFVLTCSQFLENSTSILGTEPLLTVKEGYGSHMLTGPSSWDHMGCVRTC